jgi:hypothetical protein
MFRRKYWAVAGRLGRIQGVNDRMAIRQVINCLAKLPDASAHVCVLWIRYRGLEAMNL